MNELDYIQQMYDEEILTPEEAAYLRDQAVWAS